MGTFSFILDKYLRGELLSHRVILLTFEKPLNCCPFYLPTSTPDQHLCFGVLITAILVNVKWCHIVVLISVSLMTNDFEQLSFLCWPFLYIL